MTDRPFEWVPTDVLARETRTDTFLALNPNGRVPVLVLPDGRILSESNAILIHLAENTSWLPAGAYQRAQVYQWLFFEQYSHEPYIAVARFIVHLAKMGDSKKKQMQHLWKNGNAALKIMNDHLGQAGFMVGEQLTIADIALYAYTHTAHDGGFDLQPYENIRKWLSGFEAQPGYVSMEDACQ